MKHTQPKDERVQNGTSSGIRILLIWGIFLRKRYFDKIMGVVQYFPTSQTFPYLCNISMVFYLISFFKISQFLMQIYLFKKENCYYKPKREIGIADKKQKIARHKNKFNGTKTMLLISSQVLLPAFNELSLKPGFALIKREIGIKRYVPIPTVLTLSL